MTSQNQRFQIDLVASPDDPATDAPEYQKQLNQFVEDLDGSGIPVSSTVEMLEAAGAESLLLGAFFVAVGQSLQPALPILTAYVRGKFGRKVKMKVNGDEFEASTPEEVLELVQIAEQYKQHTEPKRIHER